MRSIASAKVLKIREVHILGNGVDRNPGAPKGYEEQRLPAAKTKLHILSQHQSQPDFPQSCA